MHFPKHYLSRAAICQPRERYLPLLVGFGVVDDGGSVVDVDGGVVEEDDEAGGEVFAAAGGSVAGGVVPGVDDVAALDDVEGSGVAGGVVEEDDEGEGVTTGGVVVVVGDVSRLQPATPSTSPVQSSVTKALFIVISKSGKERAALRI